MAVKTVNMMEKMTMNPGTEHKAGWGQVIGSLLQIAQGIAMVVIGQLHM